MGADNYADERKKMKRTKILRGARNRLVCQTVI